MATFTDMVLYFTALAALLSLLVSAYGVYMYVRDKSAWRKHRRKMLDRQNGMVDTVDELAGSVGDALETFEPDTIATLLEATVAMAEVLEAMPDLMQRKIAGSLGGHAKRDQAQADAVYETMNVAYNSDLAKQVHESKGLLAGTIAKTLLENPTAGPIVQMFLKDHDLAKVAQPNGQARAPAPEPSNPLDRLYG